MATPKFLSLRGPLGEPITLTVAGLTAAATSVNKYVSQNVPGGWAGINRRILAAIGKDPAKKPEAIQGRYNEAKNGNWFANPAAGNMGAKNLAASTPDGLADMAAKIAVGIQGARAKGNAGDWAGESYGYAFEKLLLDVQKEIGKRVAEAEKQTGTSIAPANQPAATQAAAFPKWAGWAAALLAVGFLAKKAKMF